MKLRWTQDSVRFRITPSEMESLERGEVIEEVLKFGAGQWAARLVPSAGHGITFAGGQLTLRLSQADRAVLAFPENEGVYFQQDEQPKRYFVEKDYPCVHPRGGEAQEPVTETFAPPDGFSESKLS